MKDALIHKYYPVIYSPGRTGSTLIRYNLSHYLSYFNLQAESTHDPNYVPDGDSICVLSKRLNIFDSALSQLILTSTQEPVIYTSKYIEPFEVSIEQF